MMLLLSRFTLLLMVLDFLFMGYLTVTGFPPQFAGETLHLKNMRKPFLTFILLGILFLVLHPRRKEKIALLKERLTAFASKPYAIWLLTGFYAIMFLWQQMSEYYAVQINFIPFEFFDYILYFLFKGKVNFTGWLHRYYHLNNIMILLAPFWYFIKSPLFLEVIYGPLAAAAALPLYGIAKQRFQDPLPALLTAFIYLNYRYLQNVLLMNFCVEIFYPLFLFSALYFALKNRWKSYFACVLLGLLVKEDSFLYFGALGLIVAFLPHRKAVVHHETGMTRFVPLTEEPKLVPMRWVVAFFTAVLSVGYFIFLTKVFIPLTGNDIWADNLNNFEGYGESTAQILGNLLTAPRLFLEVLFGSPEKLRTWFNLVSRLAFLPLLSPASMFIAIPVFPLFFHHTGRDTDFIDLRFHYAAAVLPFLFITFVFGFSNLYHRVSAKRKSWLVWTLGLVLVLINGGNYVTRPVTAETLNSIEWARRVPPGANLVTHGHLLPYVGYREYNYYFAAPFDLREHLAHEAYSKADYYLIDFNVDPYPMDRAYLTDKVKKLGQDPAYVLIGEEGERYLFKRKDYRGG